MQVESTGNITLQVLELFGNVFCYKAIYYFLNNWKVKH